MPATDHAVFLPPQDTQARIWRYMDFAKFVDVIERRELFFSRADRLGDRFEGTLSKANASVTLLRYPDPDRPKMLEQLKRSLAWQREWVYVNCWHLGDYESAAMWQQYTLSGRAMAIQSTFARLKSVLPSEAHLGTVNYVDYDSTPIPESNLFWAFLCKRRSFKHEQEVRAMIWRAPTKDGAFALDVHNDKDGLPVQIDVDELVERVIVSPTSPDWYLGLVSRIRARLGYGFPVTRSELDEQPLF